MVQHGSLSKSKSGFNSRRNRQPHVVYWQGPILIWSKTGFDSLRADVSKQGEHHGGPGYRSRARSGQVGTVSGGVFGFRDASTSADLLVS